REFRGDGELVRRDARGSRRGAYEHGVLAGERGGDSDSSDRWIRVASGYGFREAGEGDESEVFGLQDRGGGELACAEVRTRARGRSRSIGGCETRMDGVQVDLFGTERDC